MALLEERTLRRIAERLSREFDGAIATELVEQVVEDAHARLAASARLGEFLSMLTERYARDRLQRIARTDRRACGAEPLPRW